MINLLNARSLQEVWYISDVVRPTCGGIKKGIVIQIRDDWFLVASKEQENGEYEFSTPAQVWFNRDVFELEYRREAFKKANEILDAEIDLHNDVLNALSEKQLQNILDESFPDKY